MVTFEIVENADDPPAEAASLLDCWRRFNAQGKGPTRSDFTPFTLKRWLGNIDIYEVEEGDRDGDKDFRMRLNGTEVVALTGEDWAGKTARDIDRALGASLHTDLMRVLTSKQPRADTIRIFQKDYVSAHRLLLPVFSDDGDGAVVQIFLALFRV
jgi:hypothetical protein